MGTASSHSLRRTFTQPAIQLTSTEMMSSRQPSRSSDTLRLLLLPPREALEPQPLAAEREMSARESSPTLAENGPSRKETPRPSALEVDAKRLPLTPRSPSRAVRRSPRRLSRVRDLLSPHSYPARHPRARSPQARQRPAQEQERHPSQEAPPP